MKSTLPFLSFTPSGGRIGRIAWSNGDEARWGHVRWDRWWPFQPPTPTQLSEAVAAIQQSATLMAKALIPAVQHAADAINALGAAMAKADQEVPPQLSEAVSQRLAISNTEEQQMTEKQQMCDEARAFFDAAQSSSQYQFGMSLRERRRQPGQ